MLTREERDRLKVLHETLAGHLTRKQGAEQLRLSVRQVGRLVRGLGKKGDRALGRFVEHDTAAENMRLLWRWLERFGRPLEYYTDKASLFQVNLPRHCNKRLEDAPPLMQIGRALKELGIGWIPAHSAPPRGGSNASSARPRTAW